MFVVVQTGSHLPPIRNNVFCSANCFQAIKNLIFCCASCDFWASVCLAVALSAWKCLLRAGSVRLVVSPKIALGSAPSFAATKRHPNLSSDGILLATFWPPLSFWLLIAPRPKDRAGRCPPPCQEQKSSKSLFECYSFGSCVAFPWFLIFCRPAGPKDCAGNRP